MRWRKRRCKRPTEAEQAVRESEQRLEETRAETPRIKALMAEMRSIRQENHFAERIEQALRGEAP